MAKLPNTNEDPTLKKMNECLEEKQRQEGPRLYLGMSEIGKPCMRELFYSFRGCARRSIEASGIKAIEDGYLQEDVTIKRLRAVPGIELHNDDGEGNQIGFKMLLDHFRGHCDGVVRGLVQAPQTWHCFEHKAVNETKFNKLKTLVQKDEKSALKEWDPVYYAQAMIYCHCLEMDRHYLVCALPGGRDHTSVRTDYNKKFAEDIIDKAKTIIFEDSVIPAKISDKRESFSCQWCAYKGICHDGDVPDINCRSCRYREPVKDGQNNCLLAGKIIPNTIIHVGCKQHVFAHALMPGVQFIEEDVSGCYYQIGEITFANVGLSDFPDCNKKIDCMLTSEELKALVNVNEIPSHSAIQGESSKEELIKKTFKAWE